MIILYWGFASFYRASSREVKRIDSVLRSHIYSSFGEMVHGLASVRAYNRQELFTRRTEEAVDLENVRPGPIASRYSGMWIVLQINF